MNLILRMRIVRVRAHVGFELLSLFCGGEADKLVKVRNVTWIIGSAGQRI